MDHDAIKRAAQSPMAFIDIVVVPTSKHGPQRLGSIMADFQRRSFEGIAPALISLVSGAKPTIPRFWWERTKGGSKDSDLAVLVLWVLAFCPRYLSILIGAADFDQASEMRKIMKQILDLNPWLTELIEIQNARIISRRNGAECTILSSDAASAHGSRPDLMIINELSHVANEEFVQTSLDNAAKVPNGLVVIATNAGHLDSWQWKLRQTVIDNPRWKMFILSVPAPWLDEAEIADRGRQSSKPRHRRLYFGEWLPPQGNAFDETNLNAAVKEALTPMLKSVHGWAFGLGVDLGISKDHSAAVVVARHVSSGRFQLASVKTWAPTATTRVQLADVQSGVLNLHRQFHVGKTYLDPWQGEQLAQNLEKLKIFVDRFSLNGAGWDRICRNCLELFSEGSIGLYPHPHLIDQLRCTSVIEKTNGQLRFEWARSEQHGHGDIAMAFTLALLAARDAGHGLVRLASPIARPSSLSMNSVEKHIPWKSWDRNGHS